MNPLPNPFLDTSPLNRALEIDISTEAFYAACSQAGGEPLRTGDETTDNGIGAMRQAVRQNQFDAWPLHPATIAQRFHGVTTAVLVAIESLYCDSIGRSIASVIEIMRGFAANAGVEPLDPIAIWTFCTNYAERQSQNRATTICLDVDWFIATIRLPLTLMGKTGARLDATVTCVVDNEKGQVIAFRIASDQDHFAALCLYDAIVAQRQPSAVDQAGLRWPTPRRVFACPVIGNALQERCRELPFATGVAEPSPQSAAAATLATLTSGWYRSLQERALPVQHFEQLFDNYLWRFQGHGPRRTNAEMVKTYRHLKGYNQDPLDVYPPLRRLLPNHQSRIANGVVHHDGLDYEHAYLELWPDRNVSLVPSQVAEAHVWVYFNECVICKASAIQLRRRDGTYRANR